MLDQDELTLELARIEREAFRAVVARMKAAQLGEAFIGIDEEVKNFLSSSNSLAAF